MVHGALLLLAALVSSQEGADAARWTFDGGAPAAPAKIVGRLDFIDSPVGGAGKAAVFNGIDAWIEAGAPEKFASADFTLSLWFFALDKRPATLLARRGWSLQVLDGGALRFSSAAGTIDAPAGSAPLSQWNHVVASVKRGAEGKRSSILVNGAPVASGDVKEGDLDGGGPILVGRPVEDGKPFTGLMDDVRLSSRAWDAAETAKRTDEGLPWIRTKPQTKTPFAGKFELVQDDVVVFTGGENARVGGDLAYLETLLSLNSAGKRVRFRSMAWEGDTVYEQLRPLNFGSWSDQFRRSGATVVIAQFGQIEALEGKAGLERFSAAYEALVAQFSQSTKRLVLVSPTPFGRGGPRQPDLAAKNEDLKLYVAAIRKIAEKNHCLFVDLTTKPMAEDGLTRNGLHLTGAGQWAAARETARQLEVPGLSDLDAPDPKGAFPREAYEKIRATIRTKNQLWSDAWRPMNWAFLNGDRMEQPSSRDHQDRRVRWFPVEIQQIPALLRIEEDKIEKLVEKK